MNRRGNGSEIIYSGYLVDAKCFLINLVLVLMVFFYFLNNPGARGGLLGDTNHPRLCTGGGAGGELQRDIR